MLFARGCAAYAGDHGAPANLSEAAKWFQCAAEAGHGQARLMLGCLYRDGLVVAPPGVDAVTLLTRADHPLAWYILGLIYADGQGVARDDARAGLWLRKAAAAGLSDATFRLHRMLEAGVIAPTDPGEPLYRLQQAAARGDPTARDRVAPVTRSLMQSLFKLALAAPPLPSPLSEWRMVCLEQARPPEMPTEQFDGYIQVLYSSQYLRPADEAGCAQVWIYDLLERETGRSALNLAEVARRKPLNGRLRREGA